MKLCLRKEDTPLTHIYCVPVKAGVLIFPVINLLAIVTGQLLLRDKTDEELLELNFYLILID